MDDSYSSSFESDDNQSSSLIESPKIPVSLSPAASHRTRHQHPSNKGLDLQLLNDTVRELQRLNHQRLVSCPSASKPTRSAKNRTFTEAQIHNIDQENGVLVRKIIEQQLRPVSFIAEASKNRCVPVFPSSAAINRKRKEQQIERENLLLLKKLQTVKPSSDITAWKKDAKKNSASASGQPSARSTRTSSRTISDTIGSTSRF